MLVLSRKANEEIVIDGRIRVRIVEVKGNRVVVGIDAPTDVPVHRAEIHRAMQQFQENSVEAASCRF